MQINFLLSLSVYVFAVLAVVMVMLGSYFLGQRHHERATSAPYESGIMITESARIRFPVHFYVIAMIFVVFDIESVFLYLWAVNVQELGPTGLTQAVFFGAVLLLGLAYIWRLDAFDIGPRLRKPRGIHENN
jgi:NADH-quinone oxidoreductase subunit A